MGLLQGLKCVLPQGEVQAACVAEGLMAITAGENVLRLAPPLVVTDADLDEAMAMLRRAARRVLPSTAKARRNERFAQAQRASPRAGPPIRWPARGTSSTCATSIPRRCARCWTSRPTTSAAACRRVRSRARRWR